MLPSSSFWQKYRLFFLAFAIIFIDQLTKLTVKFNLDEGESVPLIGQWFKIHYVENEGAAFGLTLTDIFAKIGIALEEHHGKLILTLVSLLAVFFIVKLLKKAIAFNQGLAISLALILGGAVGNIIDRAFYGIWFNGINNYDETLLYGRVVDMFHIDMGSLTIFGKNLVLWPVFNLADVSIFIGIVAILFFQRRLLNFDPKADADKCKQEATKVSFIQDESINADYYAAVKRI